MVDTRVVLAAEVVVACDHVLPELATCVSAGRKVSRFVG